MAQADCCTFETEMTQLELGDVFKPPYAKLEDSTTENYGTWRCPHQQTEEDSVCVFHKSVAEKTDSDVVAALVEILNTPSEELTTDKLEFVGAEFGDLDLTNHTVNLDHEYQLIFEKATFHGSVRFPSEFFENQAQFRNAEFHDSVGLPQTVESRVTFEQSTFHDELLGYGTTFESKANFESCIFNDTADLAESEYNERVDFSWVEFRDLGHFWQTTFDNGGYFHQAQFDTAVFADAESQGEMTFRLCDFISTTTFERATFPEADFSEANLSEAMFSDATLQHANFESAIVSRTAFLGADLRGCKFNGAAMGAVQIDSETQFLGKPSSEVSYSKHSLAALRDRRYCVYDPNFDGDADTHDIDKARRTYRMIEELAATAGLSRLQSQCFVRRQDLQTDQYKSDSLTAESWEERLIAGLRFSRAKVARATLLYGESPWRIIGGSLLFILSMALLYPIGGWLQPVGEAPITYSQMIGGDWGLLMESLYFSTLTFTTLGMGDYTPLGFGQILATLNTAFGAILVALLVFVLGRRAAR